MAQHFLTLLDLPPETLRALLARAVELKALHRAGRDPQVLRGKILAMVFEKASTRTRLSFEAGMIQLGGQAVFLSAQDSQLGRGEPIEDTARVVSRMVDAVMIRTFAHATAETFARHSAVPVINGLTDRFHPCQLLADVMTFQEHRGDICGRKVAWVGDGNNVCNSWINAARQFGFELAVATPEGYAPQAALIEAAGGAVRWTADPEDAVRDADLVVTDVWASMGQEAEQAARRAVFEPYRVTPALMALAKPDALFMHCLPAHRGEEVEAAVIDGPQSVVWDEAENRLHAQKALLEHLLAG